MTLLEVTIGILATWRITALLVYDYSFEWLRQLVKVDFTDESGKPITRLGRIFGCFWCMSLHVGLWVAAAMALGARWLLLPFALSGSAIIFNHWTRIVRDVMRE